MKGSNPESNEDRNPVKDDSESDSSLCSAYDGDTPVKPKHMFSSETSQASMSKEKVDEYMNTVKGGGDPVTAMAYWRNPSQ
ncbi:uncharacterized protein BCR38DRAFT_526579 [Pseudomassariella vexata]|uniref:Uncharacterized protein n=1 Tax=Pseudomassariella vexata TaxID=1141098 RepID=A0A1Y2DL41_9PEZI|nr:uncharacterized protein BCR38DRAFT_526579 [Pseudomassariella vexata]ORY60000.1 hypothetical protein BCR38DRAFT_526579 [Pseudomassariella vexata]